MREIEIRIPDYRPDADIGGNARGHWAIKAAAVKLARSYGYIYGRETMAMHDDYVPLEGDLRLRYTVFGRTRMDGDNAMLSLKPVLDGIGQAGAFTDDSQIREWTIALRYAESDRVHITIEEIGETSDTHMRRMRHIDF